MKAWLLLSLIGHMASESLDPERPIVTSVSFEGEGCQLANHSFANTEDQTIKYCVMSVDLDLSQRCYQNAQVSTLLESASPTNATGSLVISTSIGDVEFGSPINISFSGEVANDKELIAKLQPRGPRICNSNVTLLINSTLNAQASILNQSLDVQVYEVGENFANGPIIFPVTFSGSGCPRSSAVVKANNWELSVDYNDFNVTAGEMKSCQIIVPVNLHGYCLTSVSRIADFYNAADLNWSSQLVLNDEPVVWGNEELSTLIKGENRFLLTNATEKVCGKEMAMIIDTKITGTTGVGKKGGSLKRQVLRIESLELPKASSDAFKTGPIGWLVIPLLLLIK